MTITQPVPQDSAHQPAGASARARLTDRISPETRRRLTAVLVAFGLLLWVLSGAMGGVKGATVASVLSVVAAAALLARPGIQRWLLAGSPTADVPELGRSVFLRDLAERATGSRPREALTTLMLLGASVVVAIVAASIGEKALVILVGLVILLAMVAFIKNRTLFFMFVFASSFSLILYKKFTPFLAESYAVAIYITTVDVVILFLYFIWAAEGTLFADLRAGLRNPVFMLPVAGIAITLLSAVNAVDQRLVWAEIIRYLWMFALFVYVGIRVRRKEHVWAFMFGWLVFLSVQVIVSTSQRYTGGFLGIEILALKPDPMEPNSLEFMRPFGTQIHPVFLGCVVGMVCVMVACFALHVPKGRLMRYALLACIPLAFWSTLLSKARGPLVALLPTLAVIAFFVVRRKLISPRLLVVGLLLGLIGAGVFNQQVTGLTDSMFSAESNFRENWNARWKINLIAYRMVREHPLVGTGINSFESQIDDYTYEENPFDFRPAHNLFVLMAAETGLIGLGLVIVIGLVYARYAYRLTRARDPMFVSLGIGALAVLVFLIAEELNSFTLKQDVPMAMFWTIFGLVVAANRMVDEPTPDLPELSWVRPSAAATVDLESDSPATDEEPVGVGGAR
ncbi:MAG: O-antigen ligase family protein [Microthrixaceae bacterium]|nr:O-antigen ligase family protein [Microthrixaceae bacterium]